MDSKVALGVIMMLTITLGTGTTILPSYASDIFTHHTDPSKGGNRNLEEGEQDAPSVVSGDNVYIVWFTNEGTVNSNYEVGFRASNDSGATFGPITNVSNTDNSDSINAEISAEGENIIVSYWEKNQTSFLPYARVSTDNGQTFGPRLNITANGFGTIGEAEEE